jgi:hypothetical protein
MTTTDVQTKAVELYNVLRGWEDNPSQSVSLIANALRNTARDLSEEEHAKVLRLEAEVMVLKRRLDAATSTPAAVECAAAEYTELDAAR